MGGGVWVGSPGVRRGSGGMGKDFTRDSIGAPTLVMDSGDEVAWPDASMKLLCGGRSGEIDRPRFRVEYSDPIRLFCLSRGPKGSGNRIKKLGRPVLRPRKPGGDRNSQEACGRFLRGPWDSRALAPVDLEEWKCEWDPKEREAGAARVGLQSSGPGASRSAPPEERMIERLCGGFWTVNPRGKRPGRAEKQRGTQRAPASRSIRTAHRRGSMKWRSRPAAAPSRR